MVRVQWFEVHVTDLSLSLFLFISLSLPLSPFIFFLLLLPSFTFSYTPSNPNPSASMVYQETVPVSESEVVALWKHCLELLSDGVLKFRRQVE